MENLVSLLLGVVILASMWIGCFYGGRYWAKSNSITSVMELMEWSNRQKLNPDTRGGGDNYIRKLYVFYLVGVACLFGRFVLGNAPDFGSLTIQGWGVIGLFLMAYYGSSLGVGYLFEKRKVKKVEV